LESIPGLHKRLKIRAQKIEPLSTCVLQTAQGCPIGLPGRMK
jgi:hypothetical protein